MEKETVTLVAAILAAAISLLNAVTGILSARWAETRKAVREAMAPFLPILSQGMHETLATASVIAARSKKNQELADWRTKAEDAQKLLENARVAGRYVLWDMTTALKEMRIAPDMARHASNDEFPTDAYLMKLNEMREMIDEVVRDCFVSGKLPPRRAVSRINSCAEEVRGLRSRK